MINRWYHPPRLHTPHSSAERRVGWLELFYDLIFVATIIQLGNALSAHPYGMGYALFFGLFLPVWWTWTGYTFYSNRFIVDDMLHRGLVFLQMFFIGLMAVLVPRVFEGQTQGFALAYAAVRLTLVAMYARTWWQETEARQVTGLYTAGFTAGAALWFVSAFLPSPWVYLVWVVAMVVDLATPTNRFGRELNSRFPPDMPHATERYGLFTIIVLGETFVKVLTEVSDKGGTPAMVVMAGLALAITCSVWWIYFDDVAGSRIKQDIRLSQFVWVYAHFPLAASITAIGVANKKIVFFDLFEPAAAKYRWLLCLTVGLAFLSVGVIDAVTERRQAELSDRSRVNVRIASAFLILILAPVGGTMSALAFVGLVAVACVLQVVFDLTAAPHAMPPQEHHGTSHLSGANRSAPPPIPPGGLEQGLRTVLRKGIPNEFRRDLYFHFMEGGWTRLFGYVLVVFVLGNVFFGALYLLDPSSVSGLSAGSFMDAFAFSVQTSATIGYGVMAPQSAYGHVLVAAQALISLIAIALITGIVFAKASRPQGSVLFSNVMVVSTRHGVPTLSFRAGNARGNEIVEATVRIALLRDEVTPEGHTMRKLHDVIPERSLTPLFRMTWSVFHRIDEQSPLFGVNEGNCDDSIVGLIVTMTGHDATYGQTVHARKLYQPEHVLWNRRFVDVIGRTEDGRMLIDYDLFHDTIADVAEAPTDDEDADLDAAAS